MLGEIEVLLVPTDGLDPGSQYEDRESPKPRAPLTIREISVGSDRAAPQPPRDEQEELRRREEGG